MNFPIPVNMTVDSGEAIQMTVQGDVTVSCVVDLRISPNVQETYDGPYSVTPTESVQTLETAEKAMTDDVTVGAIPSDYVGSSVPRKTSADITASGPTVTAPAGYYATPASKAVSSGSASTPNTSITADVDVLLSATGLITATASGSQSVTPNVVEGYVGRGTAGTVSVDGLKNVQLPTQAAKTVTPTESEQTAVAANKFTTGEVKVAAIPSDYIGSNVPQKSSSDLTVFGPTVTAPSGYYAEAATKSVAVGSARVYDTAIPVTPSISVDNSGKITASVSKVQSVSPSVNAGYVTAGYAGNMSVSGSAELQMTTQAAQTITPTESEQTAVAAGKYTTGIVKVNGIPSDYVGSTVTRKAAGTYTPSNVAQEIAAGQYLTGAQTISAIAPPYYDMGGALAWLGAGAELVTTFTLADVKLSATGFNTWTPSTTAADILATRNAGTFTATDAPNWNYFIVWETRIPIVYASAGTNKAKPLFLASIIINAIFRRPSGYDNVMASNYNNTVNATAYTGNFLRYYGSTANSMTYTYNASYGLYGAATAATFSSATADSPTVTAKTPKISARCSTTYMSTANAGYIDKDKTIISQKGYVYKAKRSTFIQGCYEREIALVNEVDA